MEKEYDSKYSDGRVTAAQHLADIACERIAKREKEVLSRKYWQLEKWAKIFRRQIVAANALLKEYSVIEIVGALNSYRGKNIYSLGLKKPISEIIANNKFGEEVKRIKFKDPQKQEEFLKDDWSDDADIFGGSGIGSISKYEKAKKSEWEKLQ